MARVVALILLLSAGCGLPRARHHTNHRVPMSAAHVAQINTGDAVVSYLRQRDADPAVCTPSPTAPHVVLASQRELEDLVDGVGRGVRLDKWEACLEGLLEVLPPPLATVVVDRLLERYVERIVYERLEGDGPLLEQLDSLRRVYDERPTGRDPSEETIAVLVERMELRDATTTHTGRQYRQALLAILYLERGLTRDGRPIDVTTLDRLVEQADEGALLVYSRRIPDPRLREEARRRLVRVRIQLSPFEEVRANADRVLEQVLATGRYPVTIQGRPEEVRLDMSAFPFRGVAVIQDVAAQTARLVSYREDERNTSVVPPLELRGLVWFEVAGWSRPLTLCAPPEELDPTPCVDPALLGVGVPIATVEGDGRFRFLESIGADQVLALHAQGDELRLPILFRGEPVAEARWSMRFSTERPLVFQPDYGRSGPRVDVEIDATGANVLYTVREGGRRFSAVVEPDRMREFGVIAAGGSGRPGVDGQDGPNGQDGANGQNASCPNTPGTNGGAGGPGGPGGNGGPGGDGGPGGLVRARLACKHEDCAAMQATLDATLRAPGGAAGPGGRAGQGGRGGSGGAGGNSAYCDGETIPGGQRGADGANGPDGMPGPDGRPGAPGRVVLDVRPHAR